MLVQKFLKWIKLIPQSQLGNLDYTKFASYVGLSSIETQKFFQYLYKNEYVYLNVSTKCPVCNCECVIDTKLNNDIFECGNCGEEFNWKNRIELSNFLYRVNSGIFKEDEEERISSPLEILADDMKTNKKVIAISDKIKEWEKINREGTEVDEKNKVFIVHGHDEATARRVKEFIKDDLKMDAIILMDEVNNGRTIPEKFEQYASECSYAVILMTPDDEFKCEENNEMIYRARQNVILELGYFWAKFDRKKFAVITKGNVEKPSDIEGVLYLKFTDSVKEVFYELGREIKASLNL